MAVNLQMTPVTNTLPWQIRLINGGGAPVAILAPGAATVLTLTFDRVRVITPMLPHHVRVQNPNVAVAFPPGMLGYFRSGMLAGAPLVFAGAAPGAPAANAVSFS